MTFSAGTVLTLAVQRVSGDHGVAYVADLIRQWLEPGDLFGFAVHVGVGQDHAVGLVAGCEDVPSGSVGGAGAAQRLAVEGDRSPGCRGAVVARLASQTPIAAVSSCGSMACNSQRIIASDGSRSIAMPSASAVVSGASALHSAIATYER
jgi:hypothetical protein